MQSSYNVHREANERLAEILLFGLFDFTIIGKIQTKEQIHIDDISWRTFLESIVTTGSTLTTRLICIRIESFEIKTNEGM